MSKTRKLRELLSKNTTLVAPGAYDGLSARLVEQGGFKVIYASGGAISRSCGYPDLGLLSFTEICQRLQHMANVTNIPIIADADTGYGNVLNIRRTVRTFESLGIAGMHIEDQTFPKRCGHLANKTLIPAEQMVQKIKIAKESQSDANFLLIARTDAIAVEGFDRAIKRAKAYAEAGADMLFVEAPESVEQIEQIAKEIPQAKLINMFYGGKTPLVPVEQLQKWGYQIVIIPSDLQRAAIKSMQKVLAEILTHGDSQNIADQLVSFHDREAILGTDEYLKFSDE